MTPTPPAGRRTSPPETAGCSPFANGLSLQAWLDPLVDDIARLRRLLEPGSYAADTAARVIDQLEILHVALRPTAHRIYLDSLWDLWDDDDLAVALALEEVDRDRERWRQRTAGPRVESAVETAEALRQREVAA